MSLQSPLLFYIAINYLDEEANSRLAGQQTLQLALLVFYAAKNGIFTDVSGNPVGPILKDLSDVLNCLTLEDGDDKFPRNVCLKKTTILGCIKSQKTAYVTRTVAEA